MKSKCFGLFDSFVSAQIFYVCGLFVKQRQLKSIFIGGGSCDSNFVKWLLGRTRLERDCGKADKSSSPVINHVVRFAITTQLVLGAPIVPVVKTFHSSEKKGWLMKLQFVSLVINQFVKLSRVHCLLNFAESNGRFWWRHKNVCAFSTSTRYLHETFWYILLLEKKVKKSLKNVQETRALIDINMEDKWISVAREGVAWYLLRLKITIWASQNLDFTYKVLHHAPLSTKQSTKA